ncbi:hypothetical protein [Pseudomonas sp. R3-52-08]|uniref:hypothetical protein n=1 Tax=Pseudomonas sp. R3-52-08 TaxID=1173284 RepID=UPI000F5651FA|nr:hypothetical protein [Pseudomonas sp. R3-52-08]AZF22423.1 hypothetical protein C4J91_3689 [Pseudomonas sp. R3-52-08]
MTESASNFVNLLIKLVNECGCIHGDQGRAIEYLARPSFSIDVDPRVETEDNGAALYAMQSALMNEADRRYGKFEENRIFPRPFYMQDERERNSKIMALLDSYDYGIKVGMAYDTWERVFYQVCHETIHLLNPATAPMGRPIIAATLDEGVAVKFAEDMYAEHISSYCPMHYFDSPLQAHGNKYKQAYDATSKIPDLTLKAIRSEFGGFTRANDARRLFELAGEYISENEARLLCSNFQ